MNDLKDGQIQLSDSDCIRLAKQASWTLRQAVHYLHGQKPPGQDLTINQLVKKFSDLEKLMVNLPSKNPTNYQQNSKGCKIKFP